LAKKEYFYEKWSSAVYTLSREELYYFGVLELSKLIISIEKAISCADDYRFLLLCFGEVDSSDIVDKIKKDLMGYLQRVKDVHRFKSNEIKRKENFLKGVNS